MSYFHSTVAFDTSSRTHARMKQHSSFSYHQSCGHP